MRNKVNIKIETPFRIANDALLILRWRIYVPNNKIINKKILQEAPESKFTIHLGSTKMY